MDNQKQKKEEQKIYTFVNDLKNPSIQPFKRDKLLILFSIIILVNKFNLNNFRFPDLLIS